MTKTLMTFGDSNTHGTPPIITRGEYQRYPSGVRWPTIAQAALGDGWTLIEAGLPGRTTARDCPMMGAHMNGQVGLRIALETHGPIDLLTIMLGTNDLKFQFGLTPEAITGGVSSLLSIAMSEDYQTRHDGFNVLLICPPLILEQGPLAMEFFGAAAKSQALAPLYKSLAKNWNIDFLNAGLHIDPSAQDGVHFDANAHAVLGNAVAAKIATI